MFARAIHSSGIEFDAFFGAAYKGIPLSSAICAAWYELFGENKGVVYDRKEEKQQQEVNSAYTQCLLTLLKFDLYRDCLAVWFVWWQRLDVACSITMQSDNCGRRDHCWYGNPLSHQSTGENTESRAQ
jgi:hypothetical protein